MQIQYAPESISLTDTVYPLILRPGYYRVLNVRSCWSLSLLQDRACLYGAVSTIPTGPSSAIIPSFPAAFYISSQSHGIEFLQQSLLSSCISFPFRPLLFERIYIFYRRSEFPPFVLMESGIATKVVPCEVLKTLYANKAQVAPTFAPFGIFTDAPNYPHCAQQRGVPLRFDNSGGGCAGPRIVGRSVRWRSARRQRVSWPPLRR